MEAKEIEDKAIDYAGQFEERYQLALFKAFIQGAEWMQEQKQAEVDELSNKVSELTEALDAGHIFCEGVSDLMAEKAWSWFCTNLDKFTKEIRLEDAIKLYSQYKQAMKGE